MQTRVKIARICGLVAGAMLFATVCLAADITSPGFTADDLFTSTRIWTVHLTIRPDQWKAMQPIHADRRAQQRAHPERAARNGYLASQGVDFPNGHADIDIEGKVFRDVGVRFKGNGTFLNAVRDSSYSHVSPGERVPYKVHLNEFVKGQKLAGKITTLDFRNNITDATAMNEVLGYRLYRDAGVPASRTTYARLFLTIPGQVDNRVLGVYTISEDVGGPYLEERFGDGKGALLKPFDRESFALFRYRGENWADYVPSLDPKDPPTPEDRKQIIDFCRLMSNGSDAELAQRLGSFIDLDEVSRFMAVTVWLSDGDSMMDDGQNFYAWLDPKTRKLRFMPWDLDHTFGQFPQHLNQRQRETRPILPPWYRSNKFLERLFKVPAFREPYLARLREFSGTLFDPQRLAKQVDELIPRLRPAIAEQGRAAKDDSLDRFDKASAGRSIELREFGSGDIVPIKTFAIHRATFVKEQLARMGK